MKNIFLATVCLFTCLQLAQAQSETGKKADGYPAPPQSDLKTPPARIKPVDDKSAPAVYFKKQITKLKNAYQTGNFNDLVATEQKVQDLLRKQTQDLEAKIAASTPAPAIRLQHLEQMKRVLTAFDGHSFDLSKPEAAEKDFALLDEFANVLQAESEAKD